jgi:hypothetical protein
MSLFRLDAPKPHSLPPADPHGTNARSPTAVAVIGSSHLTTIGQARLRVPEACAAACPGCCQGKLRLYSAAISNSLARTDDGKSPSHVARQVACVAIRRGMDHTLVTEALADQLSAAVPHRRHDPGSPPE